MQVKAVLHVKNQAIVVPVSNIPELRKRLHMSFVYTEVLWDTTYDHYDVWGLL